MSNTRVFFAAMPPPSVVAAIAGVVERSGVGRQLGAALFAPGNWHQSLSERVFNASEADIQRLRGAGALVRGHACTLEYNRITSARDNKGRVQVTLRAYGEPPAFKALVAAVQQPLPGAGYAPLATGITPHTTLSYDAPAVLDTVAIATPLRWTLDELLLVMGHGRPYRYDVIDRWALLPERDPRPTQCALF